jgi:hypothetical protein
VTGTECVRLIRCLGVLLSYRDYETLDKMYGAMKPDNMEDVEIIAYIRTTYALRNYYTNWYIFLDRAKDVFKARHGIIATAKLLQGLPYVNLSKTVKL